MKRLSGKPKILYKNGFNTPERIYTQYIIGHLFCKVSRDNVTMALATILQSYSQKRVVATDSSFAVNITATSVFPWHRWLRNVVEKRELIGSGIVKVFALCQTSVEEAQIVFCHPDDTYTCAKPGKRLQYERFSGWRDCSTFAQAPIETVSWMQTRAQQL